MVTFLSGLKENFYVISVCWGIVYERRYACYSKTILLIQPCEINIEGKYEKQFMEIVA
jgi:hypothetical protein